MTQNLIDLTFSDEQLRAIDGAIAVLEANLPGLVALTPTQRLGATSGRAGVDPPSGR